MSDSYYSRRYKPKGIDEDPHKERPTYVIEQEQEKIASTTQHLSPRTPQLLSPGTDAIGYDETATPHSYARTDYEPTVSPESVSTIGDTVITPATQHLSPRASQPLSPGTGAIHHGQPTTVPHSSRISCEDSAPTESTSPVGTSTITPTAQHLSPQASQTISPIAETISVHSIQDTTQQSHRYQPGKIDEDPHKDCSAHIGIEETASVRNSPTSFSVLHRSNHITEEALTDSALSSSETLSPRKLKRGKTFQELGNIFDDDVISDEEVLDGLGTPVPPNHGTISPRAEKFRKGRKKDPSPDAEASTDESAVISPRKRHLRLRSMATSALYDTALQDQDELRTGIRYGQTAYRAGRYGYRGIRSIAHGVRSTSQYLVRTAKKISARITSAESTGILKVIAAKAVLPAISIIIVILLVFTSLMGTSTINDSAVTVSNTYGYITELDADTSLSMRRSAAQADLVKVNGLTVSTPVTVTTNVDFLLQYLSSKYHTVDLSADIDGVFGNTVRQEIDAIHDDLYSINSYMISIPDPNIEGQMQDALCVEITIKSLSELIAPYLNDDERSIIEMSGRIGQYAGQQALSDPLPNGYYIAERWGWHIDNGQKEKRQSAHLIPTDASQVLSPCTGQIVDVGNGSVTISTNDGLTVWVEGMINTSVSSGSTISAGSLIGKTDPSGIIITVKQDGHYLNPLMLLPQRSLASGDGQPLVDVALQEIGNIGGDEYIRWYGFAGHVDWCAVFVSWCADQIGILNTAIPKYAVVDDGVTWFQSHGAWQFSGTYIPQAGDIIFYDWELDGDPDHTGIVADVHGDQITVIEGNTGDPPGAVKKKVLPLHYSYIYGYGTPSY